MKNHENHENLQKPENPEIQNKLGGCELWVPFFCLLCLNDYSKIFQKRRMSKLLREGNYVGFPPWPRAFRKRLTSRGPLAHCSGPETPTQWKAVSGSDGWRDLSISKSSVQLNPPMTKNILQLFPQSIKIGMSGQYKVSAVFF